MSIEGPPRLCMSYASAEDTNTIDFSRHKNQSENKPPMDRKGLNSNFLLICKCLQ